MNQHASEDMVELLKLQTQALNAIEDEQRQQINVLNDLKFQVEENGRELRKLNGTLDLIGLLFLVCAFFYLVPYLLKVIKLVSS